MAAEAKLLLEDKSTPAALKEPVVKELLMQERKLTDKLRQVPIAGGEEPPPRDDEGNLMEGLQEGLFKELIKSINMGTSHRTSDDTQKGTCHTCEDQERTRHPCKTGNVQDSFSHSSISKEAKNETKTACSHTAKASHGIETTQRIW